MSNDDMAFVELRKCIMQWVEWHHPDIRFKNKIMPSGTEKAILKKVKKALDNIPSNSYCLKRLQDWKFWVGLFGCTEIFRLIEERCKEMKNQIAQEKARGRR